MTRLEEYLSQLQRFGIVPGLERIQALLERVGHPELTYPHVLIGGTNGKGSTCEFLARLLAGQGRRVGLYTSPHIYRWNERIRVLCDRDARRLDEVTDGELLFPGSIADADFDALLEDAMPHIEAIAAQMGQPTEFEVVTLLGLWHFARARVDVAVLEVGLGGHWDATNATDPKVSVVTHVALDHCAVLGSSHVEIATDKVQIARPCRALVTAETRDDVLTVFGRHCLRVGAHLVRVEPPANVTPGDFQALNLATAQCALHELESSLDWPPNAAALSGPLQVPGRTELLRHAPDVLIDGANNPDGAELLAAHLEALPRPSASKLLLVLGILADKDYAAMVKRLAPLASVTIATQSHSPRAAPAAVIAALARPYCAQVETVEPVQAAVERALALAQPQDMICITGSFYTIAEVDRAAIAAYQ